MSRRFYEDEGVRVRVRAGVNGERTTDGWERGRVVASETDGSYRVRLDSDGACVTTWPKHRDDMRALEWDVNGEEITPE